MNIGILGGGQLAQMLAQAGKKLGFNCMFLCPNTDACAAPFGEHLLASFGDEAAQARLIEWADVVTYEFENVPLSLVETLEKQVTVHPSSKALSVARDRLKEKNCFQTLGIATADFAAIDSHDDLVKAMSTIGYPAILKTRFEGYDGKGQVVLRDEAALGSAWEQIGKVPCIVESMVPFQRELSIIAARNEKGETVYYPLSENAHREGILRLSLSQADGPEKAQAETMIQGVMDRLDYVGVLALELFQVDGKLYANEMAPRVHNSGHWTIEGTHCSQFENHLRAITPLPLGDTSSTSRSAMVNLIGSIPDTDKIEALDGAKLHAYGKEDRPGRKVGHVTLTAEHISEQTFQHSLTQMLQLVGENELVS